jgi:hypothetical protein
VLFCHSTLAISRVFCDKKTHVHETLGSSLPCSRQLVCTRNLCKYAGPRNWVRCSIICFVWNSSCLLQSSSYCLWYATPFRAVIFSYHPHKETSFREGTCPFAHGSPIPLIFKYASNVFWCFCSPSFSTGDQRTSVDLYLQAPCLYGECSTYE